jgi:hypothetical protein
VIGDAVAPIHTIHNDPHYPSVHQGHAMCLLLWKIRQLRVECKQQAVNTVWIHCNVGTLCDATAIIFNYFSFFFGFSSLAALLPSFVAAISALCAKPV